MRIRVKRNGNATTSKHKSIALGNEEEEDDGSVETKKRKPHQGRAENSQTRLVCTVNGNKRPGEYVCWPVNFAFATSPHFNATENDNRNDFAFAHRIFFLF